MFFMPDSGYPQDLVSVANTFLNDRNFEEAKHAIDEAMKDSDFAINPRAWYTKGRVYHEILKSKDPDLDNFKKDIPTFVSAVVEAYLKTKELTNPGSNLKMLADNQLKLLWAEGINQGVTYYQSKDFQRAIDAFTIAKLAKPQDSTAYIYIGYSAQNAKNYKMALESFEEVKQFGTLSKSVHNSIIICTQSDGETLQAQLDVVEDALFDYPDHLPYVLQEVNTLVNLGRFEEAESRLTTVHNRNPDSYELKLRQADLYDRIFKQAFIQGKPTRSDRYFNLASAKYEEFLNTFPNDFTANYNYAVMINEKANRFYVQGNLMSEEEYEINGTEIQEEGHQLTRKALPYMERARLLKPFDEAAKSKVVAALRVFYKRLKMDRELASINNN
jgi:tetratricopeptide (TPR) repeat protein